MSLPFKARSDSSTVLYLSWPLVVEQRVHCRAVSVLGQKLNCSTIKLPKSDAFKQAKYNPDPVLFFFPVRRV